MYIAIYSFCNFDFCLVGFVATSGIGSRVGILSEFFIRNNLLLLKENIRNFSKTVI